MGNLEEMDKFLEKDNVPRMNQEEIENMNRPITTNEIETVTKNLPTNKNPGSDGFRLQMESDEFYQTFKGVLTPICLKLFQKIAEGGTLPNSFYEATYHPNTKISQRLHKKRKLQVNITYEHRCKNPQQNASKQNPTTY